MADAERIESILDSWSAHSLLDARRRDRFPIIGCRPDRDGLLCREDAVDSTNSEWPGANCAKSQDFQQLQGVRAFFIQELPVFQRFFKYLKIMENAGKDGFRLTL